ncbi:hypothetical protein SCATT_00940 [Streptantibioticus cattleyicolor NRRL 8057 = DSM 46488]|uniref:Uncharacterized protein n=1 Tax=Streptantibioticus cattleyicolor (strain ATCC 35852 / DSM 46488 / JCM 4925 / NBRC 14057 / NRRL 8057) TaxID=1003195 RepID=G8WYS4_STREN|nr:hypothetical protein SCATT_00940 [Streptantibioticus cattleyicolor NRRL 8057 = DSM 46488]
MRGRPPCPAVRRLPRRVVPFNLRHSPARGTTPTCERSP